MTHLDGHIDELFQKIVKGLGFVVVAFVAVQALRLEENFGCLFKLIHFLNELSNVLF